MSLRHHTRLILAHFVPLSQRNNHVEDAIYWVLVQPEKWDTCKLTLSGFRAGANLALVAVSSSFPKRTFQCVLAFYPPVDLDSDPVSKIPPDTLHGRSIPAWVVRLFSENYAPSGYSTSIDRRNPKIFPLFMEPENFPDEILFITAACDSLCRDAEILAKKVIGRGRAGIRCEGMRECGHAWQKALWEQGSIQQREKERAYSLAVQTLNRTLEA